MSMTNETATSKPKKTPEQIAARKARQKAVKDAKSLVNKFTQTELFGKLPKDVQDAMAILAPTKAARAASGGGGALLSMVKGLFPKVGASVSELEIFKQTKKGRSEFKKITRNLLKKAEPAERMWIDFDAEKETWTLLAIGPKAPKGWTGINPESAPKA